MKKFRIIVNGQPFEVEIEEIIPESKPPVVRPVDTHVPSSSAPAPEPVAARSTPKKPTAPSKGVIVAPMPGNINDIRVKVGDRVLSKDVVVVLEAMKMENEITAGIEGTVKEIRVIKGQKVARGEVLMLIA